MSLISQRPEPVDPRSRRLGIYGGTFDPIHIGHLVIAAQIQADLRLDRIIFIPAGVPPHKDPALVTAAVDRLAMLELAVADDPAFTVDTLELDRDGRSFTADTLATFRERERDADLWFIMGGDSLGDLHTWRSPEAIVSLARLAVARRPGWDTDVEAASRKVPASAGRIDVIDTPLIDIASHDLRERSRQGRPIRYLVPDAVARYIDDHALYRVDDQFQQFQQEAKAGRLPGTGGKRTGS